MIGQRRTPIAALGSLALFGAMGAIGLAGCADTQSTDVVSINMPVAADSFDAAVNVLRAQIDARRAAGVPVPVPVDAGGGYTHEQHKQNAKTIYESGMLYQLTGETIYRDFAVDILNQYAALYPQIDLHPKRKQNHPAGRLFWQGLNEAWWLVYVIQGYDAILETLSSDQRATIEQQLLHPMVDFLSEGSPRTFNRIHNHGTWSAAAVGMTGYVLNERDYVDKALYGLDKSGDAGFLKQIELLFSPDGYYTEGPYYQRYALMPFILFAQAIHRNDTDKDIFGFRDGVLLKAIYTTVQLSYGGRFFPINDAIREKGLNTVELRYGMAIAYDLTGDNSLLSIAAQQDPIVPTPEGRKLAQAMTDGLAEPFEYKTLKLRDGAKGDRGALIILRSGPDPDDAAIVFKPAAQGLGHGHFDRLGLLYFDNGDEIIADYGAARFLNVEPKNGGHYLTENTSWAKQTVAHNTLVVDKASQFDGQWRSAEEYASEVLAFDDTPGASFAGAQSVGAYPGVTYRRIIAMPKLSNGADYVIDIVQAMSDVAHTYDLPVHFKGQLIETSLPFAHSVDRLDVFGDGHGYQHLWKTAETPTQMASSLQDFSLLIGDQFYTLAFAITAPTAAYLTRLGANDPDNNLRAEQALILRTNAQNAAFISVYERHGRYDSDEEVTVYSGSSVEAITATQIGATDLYTITSKYGDTIHLAVEQDTLPDSTNSIQIETGQSLDWTGYVGLMVSPPPIQDK